jgi:replicative DNA helicase
MFERTSCFQVAADVIDAWRDDVVSGKPPTLYPVGGGDLANIELGPGLVTLLGGAPGIGKSALIMQWVIDALRLTSTLRALVCNVEMPAKTLLDRQLARLSGVDLKTIRYRRLAGEHAERIDQALHTLEPLAERLSFLRPPFTLGNVAGAADAFHADLLLLDYVQRFSLSGRQDDHRVSVNATMDYLRQFADAGVAVIVVSAVGRTKDKRGRSTYDGDSLNLASFRETSELEFGCDDAFILVPDDADRVTLRHLKSRNGETRDLALRFDRPLQRFTAVADAAAASSKANGKLRSALAALWNRTPPAADDECGADE